MTLDALVKDTIIQIDLQNQDGFRQTFTDLCKEHKQNIAAELATRLLLEQEQKDALLQPNPNRERYEFILKNLKEVFPEIKNYFSKDPHRKSESMEGINIHAISAKGLRTLVGIYKQKKALRGKEVIVCDNFPVFQEKLSTFLKAAKEGNEILLFVRHRKDPKKFPQDLTRHTSPVHVIRRNNIFEFFITDSQGGHSPERPHLHAIKDIIKRIREVQPQIKSEIPFEIHYDGGTGRLGDGSNCVVLALKEGLEMVRDTEEVYNWIHQKRVSQGNDEYSVPYLPIRMVKNSQSITYITKYLKETDQEKKLFKSPNKLNDETVQDALKRHQFVGTDPKTGQRKICNGKIAHTYLKCERLIIAHCIRNKG